MDRKRRLMENNNGWPLRSQLFDGAPFRLPLLSTAVPASAATGTTATFTRATAKTWPNNDGYLVTGLAGEIGFVGARRVDNLIRLGAAQSSTLAVAASVTMTLPAGAYQFSMGAGTGTVTFSGTGGATGTLAASASGRTFVAKTISAGTLIVTASVATLIDIQVVSMVAETDQTALREYVSVGVASAPYYHGSAADGVRAFPTDLSGNPIPSTTLLGYSAEGARTNLCLQSNAFTTTWTTSGTPTPTQNVVGPDGATSAWTLTDNNAASIEGVSQTIALTAATYTYSVFVNKTTGAQSSYPVITTDNGVSRIAACTVDTTNGVATVWTAYTGLTVQTSSASCVSHDANYWRVSLTFLATAENWVHYLLAAATANATQSTGTFDVTAQGSAVFSGAQVELGSSASSYIATTTIAVAKNPDIDSATTSGNITAAAGSVYLEFTPTHSPSGTIAFWGTYVDASNYTAILHDATNLIFRKRIAGVNYDATIANAFVSGTTYKVCGSWGASGVTVTLNGTEGTPNADTTAAQIAATMQWGADGNSLQQPFASVRNCRDWLRQLSSSERRAITV